MDDTTHYYKDAPKLIYELMQDTFSDRFEYFLGMPISLDNSAYPAIAIQSESANARQDATGTDLVSELINIYIMLLDSGNAQATQGTTDTVMRELYQLVQGRDPATQFYMTGTVMYALRTNIDLGTAIIDNDIDVSYDVTPEPDSNVISATVTVAVRERVYVPNRV